jgi:hypothetical protein
VISVGIKYRPKFTGATLIEPLEEGLALGVPLPDGGLVIVALDPDPDTVNEGVVSVDISEDDEPSAPKDPEVDIAEGEVVESAGVDTAEEVAAVAESEDPPDAVPDEEAELLMMLVPEMSNPLPMDDRVVQSDDDGAGCADGVTGWPWKNVDVP